MSITWSYGITTVPSRADNLLAQTVASLAAAGFDSPAIYMDGMPEESQSPNLDNVSSVVIRWPPLGNLGNWMNALFNLYLDNPAAEMFAVFEDDFICCKNLREYLERCPYPKFGYWNLITHDQNLVLTGGIEGWHLSNQLGRGAVGLVFNNKAVRRLLSCQEFITSAGVKGRRGSADGMVLTVLKGLDYEEYIHYPSLLQHKGGGASVLGHQYGEMKGWIEGYDPLTLLKDAR